MKVNEKSKGELALERVKNSFYRIEELEKREKMRKNDRGTGR